MIGKTVYLSSNDEVSSPRPAAARVRCSDLTTNARRGRSLLPVGAGRA